MTFAVSAITAMALSQSVATVDTITQGLESVRPYPSQHDVCQIVRGALVQDHANGSVIACPTRERGAIRDRRNEGAKVLHKTGGWTLLKLLQAPDLAELTRHYIGRTIVYYDRGHGTQVEYYDKSGSYLWYPGNTVILPGAWKVSAEAVPGGHICFRYPTSSLNPVTGVKGWDWECFRLRDQQASTA